MMAGASQRPSPVFVSAAWLPAPSPPWTQTPRGTRRDCRHAELSTGPSSPSRLLFHTQQGNTSSVPLCLAFGGIPGL